MKNKKIILKPDLIPATTFFKNLRSLLPQKDWDYIRKAVYRRAGYRCQICGGQGATHPVECHEQWEYNEETKMQTLSGLIALCPMCHKVQHIGLAFIQGHHLEVVEHMMKVNGINSEKAYQIISDAFTIHGLRSEIQWGLDIDYIHKFMEEQRNNPPYTLN